MATHLPPLPLLRLFEAPARGTTRADKLRSDLCNRLLMPTLGQRHPTMLYRSTPRTRLSRFLPRPSTSPSAWIVIPLRSWERRVFWQSILSRSVLLGHASAEVPLDQKQPVLERARTLG
jgi:hypothetical protein